MKSGIMRSDCISCLMFLDLCKYLGAGHKIWNDRALTIYTVKKRANEVVNLKDISEVTDGRK